MKLTALVLELCFIGKPMRFKFQFMVISNSIKGKKADVMPGELILGANIS